MSIPRIPPTCEWTTQGRLYLAAVWTALTVALLSALLPIGAPASVSVGSAFNPATTGVVLKAGPQSRFAIALPVRDDGPTQPGGGDAVLPQLAALPADCAVEPAAPVASGTTPFAGARYSCAWPRGPPA